MSDHCPRLTGAFLVWGAVALTGSVSGCVNAVPQDVVEAIESIDRDLMDLRAAEFSPADYAQFSQQWMALKTQAQADEDLIRWPWELNNLELALRRLQEEGSRTVARLTTERESLRRSAEEKIARVENRLQNEQGQYDRSLDASDRAAQSLAAQSEVLSSESGRHTD
ncbi:MAG TPA: hypothetical protein VJ760_07595 [Nitrospiraceae bacterium]|nr:hypothetical protein [Nitrospiraceae bacterium]